MPAGMGGAAVSSLTLVPALAGCGGDDPALFSKGEILFRNVGCQQCHVYDGKRSANVGAPDLTCEGDRDRGLDRLVGYIADPSQFGDNVMPRYQSVGRANVRELPRFLERSTF